MPSVHATKDKEGKPAKPPKSRNVTITLVNNTLQALGGMCLLPMAVEAPAWLEKGNFHPAKEILVAANGLVHLPSLVVGQPAMVKPTTAFFTTIALDYDFQGEAAEP